MPPDADPSQPPEPMDIDPGEGSSSTGGTSGGVETFDMPLYLAGMHGVDESLVEREQVTFRYRGQTWKVNLVKGTVFAQLWLGIQQLLGCPVQYQKMIVHGLGMIKPTDYAKNNHKVADYATRPILLLAATEGEIKKLAEGSSMARLSRIIGQSHENNRKDILDYMKRQWQEKIQLIGSEYPMTGVSPREQVTGPFPADLLAVKVRRRFGKLVPKHINRLKQILVMDSLLGIHFIPRLTCACRWHKWKFFEQFNVLARMRLALGMKAITDECTAMQTNTPSYIQRWRNRFHDLVRESEHSMDNDGLPGFFNQTMREIDIMVTEVGEMDDYMVENAHADEVEQDAYTLLQAQDFLHARLPPRGWSKAAWEADETCTDETVEYTTEYFDDPANGGSAEEDSGNEGDDEHESENEDGDDATEEGDNDSDGGVEIEPGDDAAETDDDSSSDGGVEIEDGEIMEE